MNDRERAEELFEAFSGEEATEDDIKEVSQSDTILIMGEINHIAYTTDFDDKCDTYIHEFETRPLLGVSADGKQLYILSGEYEVTENGIEG